MPQPSPNSLSPLCVYCGASRGGRPEYSHAAAALGAAMARRGISLVYGGGRSGLMGDIADSVLSAPVAAGVTPPSVTGIITRELVSRELAHTGLHELRIVDSMHERKKAMAELARGFIALPGGVGTLDEFFEIIAWAQLGIHAHPIGLLNVLIPTSPPGGYFDSLLTFIRHMGTEGFLRIDPRQTIIVEADPDSLLERMAHARH